MTLESQHTEWMESWRDDHRRGVRGFATADCGRLEIGRDAAGVVVGLGDASKLLEDPPNKIRDAPGILVSVNLRQRAALAAGVLEKSISANPNSHLRKHRLTAAGKRPASPPPAP